MMFTFSGRKVRSASVLALLAAAAVSAASTSYALVVSQIADQATWPGGVPTIDTTNNNTPQATMIINAGAVLDAVSKAVVQTFKTGSSAVYLDRFQIYAAGAPVNNASIHLYRIDDGIDWSTRGFLNPTYDAPGDVFVDLWNPTETGSGLTFSFFGTATQTYVDFDLQGPAEELLLLPNSEYAIEFWGDPAAIHPNGMFWRRSSTDVYANGNVYAAPNTPAAGGYVGGPGGPIGGGSPENISRTDISGGGKRDAALAIYGRAVPEPTSIILFGLGLMGVAASRRRAS